MQDDSYIAEALAVCANRRFKRNKTQTSSLLPAAAMFLISIISSFTIYVHINKVYTAYDTLWPRL